MKFSYKTKIYCSSCFRLLKHNKEACSNDECRSKAQRINSELILFDLAEELRSVVTRNYSLIKWYRENRQKAPTCDILFGTSNFCQSILIIFFLSSSHTGKVYQQKSSIHRLSLMLATDGKPLTVSTNSSIWPVGRERFSKK